MKQPLQLPEAPLIAQVQTPTGATWYVPRAQCHGPFLVQRRYQGTGHESYRGGREEQPLYRYQTHLVPVLVPYLNPEAVRVAGLDMRDIMAWSVQHPGQIFTHPTYAQLCLRWGENAHAYNVSTLPSAANQDFPSLIALTPYTCWLTGQTYYQVDAERLSADVFLVLTAQAGMLPHEQELGLEGTWPGWYVLDYERACSILTASDYHPALACPRLYYGVWIYPGAIGEEIKWLLLAATSEEARTYYQRLPEVSDRSQPSITASWGYTLSFPGQETEWDPMSERQVPLAYAEDLWHNRVFPYPVPPVGTQPSSGMAPGERPLERRIPMLRERVSAGPYPRRQLVQQLGWEPGKLAQIERYPWELTLAEVRHLAQLLKVEEEELLADVRHEFNAWEAEQKKQVGKGVGHATFAI